MAGEDQHMYAKWARSPTTMKLKKRERRNIAAATPRHPAWHRSARMRNAKERHDDAEDPDVDDSRCRIHGPPRTGDGPLHVHLSTSACPRVRKRHAHAHAFMLLLATHPDPLKEASK